ADEAAVEQRGHRLVGGFLVLGLERHRLVSLVAVDLGDAVDLAQDRLDRLHTLATAQVHAVGLALDFAVGGADGAGGGQDRDRRPESTAAVAQAFGIPRTFEHWQDLVADPDVDAIVIGTWPYLHCPITLAALAAGKHVLTEARLSMNADEAHRMLAAAQAHPELVTQVVPSPFGLKGDQVMRELIQGGYLGELREVQVFGLNGAVADP